MNTIINAIAYVLGFIMQGIFIMLGAIASFFTNGNVTVGNIGIAIILFTAIVYTCMLPLTYRQQKFSKLQNKMQPEIKAIQSKYKDKKDQESQMAMNQEIQAVYKKYGVSMTGSCVQMLLQMAVLFPLYRVIYNMPKYVPAVNNIFAKLSDALVNTKGAHDVISSFSGASQFTKELASGANADVYTEILNKASSADWNTLSNWAANNDTLTGLVQTGHKNVLDMNNFLGLTISDSPSYMFKNATANGFSSAALLAIIGALIVPILAWFTQYLSVKLTTSITTDKNAPKDPNDPSVQMQQSMKTMNIFMPLFSAFLCFSMPAGIGLYWIASAVVRTILSIIVNHRIDKIDIDQMIKDNQEKYEKQLAKAKVLATDMKLYASFSSRNPEAISKLKETNPLTEEERQKKLDEAAEYYKSGKARPNSLLYAANLVKKYEEDQLNK